MTREEIEKYNQIAMNNLHLKIQKCQSCGRQLPQEKMQQHLKTCINSPFTSSHQTFKMSGCEAEENEIEDLLYIDGEQGSPKPFEVNPKFVY